MEYAVEMRNISKAFGDKAANNGVNLGIRKGEILSLLGENGSGKTTLMNMLSGIYFPDDGQIFVRGREVTIRSPKDALELGIGMIHQHFKLVDVFSAAENVVLGLHEQGSVDRKSIAAKVMEICDRYGFRIDPNEKVYNMSVSQKQTLEIIKVLYRGAEILILDEPTAVLTPQETEKLFEVIRNMRADGKSVVIITHKLNEVMAVSDRVAVLRKGYFIGEVMTKDTNPQQLTEMMVGHAVSLNIRRDEPRYAETKLSVEHLSVRSSDGLLALNDVSFDVRGGEILGVAGISGSGQKELLEAIAGLQRTEPGSSILYRSPEGKESQLVGMKPTDIQSLGIHMSFVPEDRLGMGLVGSMGMSDNMMLKSYRSGKGLFTERKHPRSLAAAIREELGVVTPSLNTPVRKLSGGNVQKVLVGREIALAPNVLMMAYAVRGLDINTSYVIYNLLAEQKRKGVAVIYVGEDLDVLLELCDRILVLCGGVANEIADARTTTKDSIGYSMTYLKEGKGK